MTRSAVLFSFNRAVSETISNADNRRCKPGSRAWKSMRGLSDDPRASASYIDLIVWSQTGADSAEAQRDDDPGLGRRQLEEVTHEFSNEER